MILPLIARLFGYRCYYDFFRTDNGKHAPVWHVSKKIDSRAWVDVSHQSLLVALKWARTSKLAYTVK